MVDHEQTTIDLRFDKPSKGRQAEIVSRQVISVRQGTGAGSEISWSPRSRWKFRWEAPTRT